MGVAILDFITRNDYRYCYSVEILLCEIIEQQ